MTTSSARPDRLRGFALITTSRIATVTDQLAMLASAIIGYQQTCPDGAAMDRLDIVAKGRVDLIGSLAAEVGQIGEAFARADSSGDPVARPDDVALSDTLVRLFPGLATGGLLDPRQYRDGQILAQELNGLGPEDAAVVASELGSTLTSPPMAAGFYNELGADGLIDLYSSIATAHETGLVGSDEFDLAMVGITDGLRQAGLSLPDNVASTSLTDTEIDPGTYGLDIGVIDGLAGSDTGQTLIRHISITGQELDPILVAHLAGALFDPSDHPIDQLPPGTRALRDRLRARGRPLSTDLPMLELLQAKAPAAEIWEAGSPPGTSRIAVQFTRRNTDELEAATEIARGLYIDPVASDLAQPWTQPIAGESPSTRQARTETALDGIVISVQGMDAPPPTTSGLLVDLVEVHPQYYDDAIADRSFESLEPDGDLVGYFEVIARHHDALDDMTDLVVDRGGAAARVGVSRLGTTDLSDDALREAVQPARHVGLYLEAGANRAGAEHNALAAFAVLTIGKAAGIGVGKASTAAGPPGAVIGYLGTGLVKEGKRELTDRYVDTNRRLDEKPAAAMDRSLPYLAAVAMAKDPGWQPLIVAPERLEQIRVVDSDEAWQGFQEWIGLQPPVVAATLASLVPGPG